jgi:hypothetical protein
MIHFPHPKSSMPKIHCDPRRFRTRQISHTAEKWETAGHHVSVIYPSFRKLLFKFVPYMKEAPHADPEGEKR